MATACKIQRSIASNGVLHTGYHTRGQWFFDFDLQLLLTSVSEHEAQEAFSSHMSTVFETFTSCPTYYAAAACLYICRCPRSIIFTHKRCHTRHTHTVIRKPSRTVAQRASPASSRRRLSTCCTCSCLAAGESAIKYKTRTAHSEALIVRGTGCDVVHLDLAAGEVLPLRAGTHLRRAQ